MTKEITEKVKSEEDYIETPTLYELFHGQTTLKEYLSNLPTKFGEWFYSFIPH